MRPSPVLPNIGGPIALAGAIALGSGIGRYRSVGLDREAALTLAIGVVLLIASLPLLSSLTGIRMPRLPAVNMSQRSVLTALAVGIAAIGLAWFASGGRGGLPGIPRSSP